MTTPPQELVERGGKAFPMLRGPKVPWALGEVLYEAYAFLYGRSQSIERIAERGGLGWAEIGIIFDEIKRKSNSKYNELRTKADALAALPTAQAADRIASLEAENRMLAQQVEIDAIIFEEYERLHRKKGTHEGETKARRNGQYAADCRALLNQRGK